MENEDLISVHEFCRYHNIEITFVHALTEYGLIKITTVEETLYIHKEQLSGLEKMIRLHYELDINIEGIDAISHLLQRVDHLNEELMVLKNRLRIHEEE